MWCGQERYIYNILVAEDEGKRELGKSRHMWKGTVYILGGASGSDPSCSE
jgi:hypothetical protein